MLRQKMYLNIFWVIPVLMMLRPATCSARSASGCAVNPFCPLGPWLETELDPSDLSIRSYVNGVLKQDARTSNMIYNPYEILSYISQSFTLDAGDLILTGTPVGAGLLNEGDEITVEIEGIGKISNRVVME